jgi:hypothetical protein
MDDNALHWRWLKVPMLLAVASVLNTCGSRHSPRSLDGQPVVQRTPLKPNRPDAKVVQLVQIERPKHAQIYRIPRFDTITDEFYQAEESILKLDILVVVDNSGSMAPFQRNLSTKMAPLLSAIQDLDWRIGIINSEWPCFKATYLPLESSTGDLAGKFSRSINQGVNGSGYERSMQMAGAHILGEEYTSTDPWATEYRKSCVPEKWMRENASLAVLILSDEDEDPISQTSPEQFVQILEDKGYKPGDNARVYGIIWRPGTKCKEAFQEGFTLNELITLTGGIAADICAEDYTTALQAISANIRDLFFLSFPLRAKPILRTLEIFLNGVLYQGRYSIIGSQLVIGQPLNVGTRLTVNYKIQEARTLTLRESSDPQSIVIMINGEEMDAHSYYYHPTERTIYFNEPLMEGATVEISYREDLPLLSEYPFPFLHEGKEVECYLNEEFIPVEYHREEGTLALKTPHRDGETIYCLYLP